MATDVGLFPAETKLGVVGVRVPVAESKVYCETALLLSYALGT
jgi:hypothetical protein